MMSIVAVWYVGLFVFAINGLLMIAHKQAVDKHRFQVERAQRIILLQIRRKRGLR